MIIKLIILLSFFIFLYMYAICPETARKERLRAFRGIMFAHRGYHCKEKGIPENSMSAFRAALKKNYGIELDVNLTKDQKTIVFHDDTLTRMCGRPDIPEQLSTDSLSECTLLDTSEHIPLLEDVLSLVNGRVPLLIELKMPGRSTRICEKVYEQLKNYPGPVLVQSFNTAGLYWFRKHAPQILRGQLSCDLMGSPTKEHWIFRFFTTHLLANFLGRPDFISYKLADLPTPSASLIRFFWKTPFAVWTLRTREAIKNGSLHYDMQIFEKSCENY